MCPFGKFVCDAEKQVLTKTNKYSFLHTVPFAFSFGIFKKRSI